MSYGYWAKGRRMRWYDWLTHLKVRTKVVSSPITAFYLLFPPEPMNVIRSTVSGAEIECKTELAKELFTQQPDLFAKYGMTTFVQSHEANKRHPVHRFVQRQYYWMQQGLTKQAAYDRARTEFGEVFVESRKHESMLREVAAFNSAVSYQTYYQHIAVRESGYRTERLLADVEKHKRAKNYSQIDEKIPDTFKKWERIRARYYPQEAFVPEPAPIQEVKNRFFTKAEFLLNTFQHKAAISDGLRALQDDSILQEVKAAPKLIASQCKSLYKELVDLGVKLQADGELDISKVKNKDLLKNLQNSELAKIVLQCKGDFSRFGNSKSMASLDPPREPVAVDHDPNLKQHRERLKEAWRLKESQSNA